MRQNISNVNISTFLEFIIYRLLIDEKLVESFWFMSTKKSNEKYFHALQ
jgi:hypothetical protein